MCNINECWKESQRISRFMRINNPECNAGKQEHRTGREKLRDKDRENWTASWRESGEEEVRGREWRGKSEEQSHRPASQMWKPNRKQWCGSVWAGITKLIKGTDSGHPWPSVGKNPGHLTGSGAQHWPQAHGEAMYLPWRHNSTCLQETVTGERSTCNMRKAMSKTSKTNLVKVKTFIDN